MVSDAAEPAEPAEHLDPAVAVAAVATARMAEPEDTTAVAVAEGYTAEPAEPAGDTTIVPAGASMRPEDSDTGPVVAEGPARIMSTAIIAPEAEAEAEGWEPKQ